MPLIFWAGACSHKHLPIIDFFKKNKLNIKISSSNEDDGYVSNLSSNPSLIVCENESELIKINLKYPEVPLIYCCSSTDFKKFISGRNRPLNRYFFSVEEQPLDFLLELIGKISSNQSKNKKRAYTYAPMLSMLNTLEVLKKITNERLEELKIFAHEEELRKRHFRSIIQLARGLSMSNDIEEVAQNLWNDLRVLEGVTKLTILISEAHKNCFLLSSRSGKFHFEEMTLKNNDDFEQLHSFFSHHKEMKLFDFKPFETNLFDSLFKISVKNSKFLLIGSPNSAKEFCLIIEINDAWKNSEFFFDFFKERLSFVQLTLEKHLLQEEFKRRVNLWEITFDGLQDPLAIINQKKHIVRSNSQFQLHNHKSCHNAFLNSDQMCFNCPKTILANSHFDLPIEDKIYEVRHFPIQPTHRDVPEAFVAHYVNVTRERALYSQLIQSEKMVAVGKLAEDLSEALTNPLRNIISISQNLIKNHQLNERMSSDLEEISKAAKRSLKITDDFENFSKGKIERSKIDAESVVEKTIPLIKALIHGHRFYLELSDKKHEIFASDSLLQQVLYNLLRNAHQAISSKGEIRILTLSKSIHEIPGVEISVLDSGSGIPENIRKNLFQPFVTSKDASNGVGLGLNIIKQIMESHQGKVGYEPRKEGGSKFWIWLPLIKV